MPSAQVFIVIVGIKITVIVTMMIFMVITGLSICISPGAAAATSLFLTSRLVCMQRSYQFDVGAGHQVFSLYSNPLHRKNQ